MPPAAAIASNSADYRSRARRLRHLYADRPVELQRQLRHLADATDRAPATRPYEPSSKARTYADFLSSQIETPLRYSKRLTLIRAAKPFGVSPFEANLLIAAVQHQKGNRIQTSDPISKPSWKLPLLAAVLTQLTVIAFMFWAFH